MSKTLPATFVIGFIGETDVRILEIGAEIVKFEADEKIPDHFCFALKVFDFHQFEYLHFAFEKVEIINMEARPFSYVYQIRLSDLSEKYLDCLNKLMLIDEHVQSAENIETLKNIVAPHPIYPKENDKIFCSDWDEQERKWWQISLSADQNSQFTSLASQFEYAFALDTGELYHQFLNHPPEILFSKIFADKGIQEHGIFSQPIRRIYIGNEFCFNLFPPQNILEQCLPKAFREHLTITMVFPFIREDNVSHMEELVHFLNTWQAQKGLSLELVINDWGMLHYLNTKYPRFTIVYGRLINKKLKDTKMAWKWGVHQLQAKLDENNLNNEHFIQRLQSWNIQRIEFDMFNQKPRGFLGGLSFHFPYFQTNSSLYCPLYAECTTYNRTKQKPVDHCPQFCNEFVYLYPEHLDLIGKGNSIFGFHREFLKSPAILQALKDNGYDRLVINFGSGLARKGL